VVAAGFFFSADNSAERPRHPIQEIGPWCKRSDAQTLDCYGYGCGVAGRAALRAQDKRLRENPLPAAATLAAKFEASRGAIVDEITFTGLRRNLAENACKPNRVARWRADDAAKIEKDVRTLAHTIGLKPCGPRSNRPPIPPRTRKTLLDAEADLLRSGNALF